MTPEQRARQNIDAQLEAAGWIVQDYQTRNLTAGQGIAVREFPLVQGFADYLLFVDKRSIGVLEAKPEGTPLSGVEIQSRTYSQRLPATLQADSWGLIFLYDSNGKQTQCTDLRDPAPRARPVFGFHQPQTLRTWAEATTSLRQRLRNLVTQHPLSAMNGQLWKPQADAISQLELSLADNRPRSLIQMATGSGKTFVMVSEIYRLVKFAKVDRVLFLVDRNNLGRQALNAFQQYATPDDGRKFTELYPVQLLQGPQIDKSAKVCITTIQRLYAMLMNQAYPDAETEEASLFEQDGPTTEQFVSYNQQIPIEMFDVIVTDECHRSIYNVWRQVLEYFDAFLIGLTATPSAQTFGFFNQNLVMEYTRQQAVADGVNVDGDVFRIRTLIGTQGSTVEAEHYVDYRSRETRQVRWEKLDEDVQYSAADLDRDVVAIDQIRTVLEVFRDALFTTMFPERSGNIVPKTLIFAKSDNHAEDIVRIAREVFAKGNDFCQKITYRSAGKPEELISQFRNSYYPRIAVTVDMIATGTDIKPLEVVLFMRSVESRVLFEQMIGRGTRVISASDLQEVTSDALAKTRFVIIDAVGVIERNKFDTQSLEQKPSTSLADLLELLASGSRDPEVMLTVAGRIARLDRQLTDNQRYQLERTLGQRLAQLSAALLDACSADAILANAQERFQIAEPTPGQLDAVAEELASLALEPLYDPIIRNALLAARAQREQLIDHLSRDQVREAGFSSISKDHALQKVQQFQDFVAQNRNSITALQMLYNQPYALRSLSLQHLQELSEALATAQLLPLEIWESYRRTGKATVVNPQTTLTDLISLVGSVVNPEQALVPFPSLIAQRMQTWLAEQAAAGINFSQQQRWWLDQIANHIGLSLQIQAKDLGHGAFADAGGVVALERAFGSSWKTLLIEVQRALVG
ncbi:MAG: DEAD/DEAH box helicase family protein [Chloroflexi bacterium]|nr:DEAD/DEAH box helicase family protein [Chloroflexota bacterium]